MVSAEKLDSFESQPRPPQLFQLIEQQQPDNLALFTNVMMAAAIAARESLRKKDWREDKTNLLGQPLQRSYIDILQTISDAGLEPYSQEQKHSVAYSMHQAIYQEYPSKDFDAFRRTLQFVCRFKRKLVEDPTFELPKPVIKAQPSEPTKAVGGIHIIQNIPIEKRILTTFDKTIDTVAKKYFRYVIRPAHRKEKRLATELFVPEILTAFATPDTDWYVFDENHELEMEYAVKEKQFIRWMLDQVQQQTT